MLLHARLYSLLHLIIAYLRRLAKLRQNQLDKINRSLLLLYDFQGVRNGDVHMIRSLFNDVFKVQLNAILINCETRIFLNLDH